MRGCSNTSPASATGTDPMRAISIGPALPTLLVGEKSAGTAVGDPTRPNFLLGQLTSATLTYASTTGIGSAAHGSLMRDVHTALILHRAAGGAFLVAPVADRLLFVVIAHRVGLGLPMSQRLGEFIRKIF